MKRQERAYRNAHFGPIHLDLDDIEEICAILRTGGEEVEISDDEYEYDNVGELKEQRGTRVNRLFLNRHSYSRVNLSVTAGWKGVDLTAYKDEQSAAFYKISELLQRRTLRFGRLFGHPLFGGVAVSGGLYALALFAATAITRSSLGIRISGLSVVLCGVLFVAHWRYKHGAIRPCIELVRRHQATTFWSRKMDEILLIVLTAIVTTLITLICTKLFGSALQ